MASSSSLQSKKQEKRKNSRRWTSDEIALFAEILVDDDNFLTTLEELALKCSSNDEVFHHIKTIFDKELNADHFVSVNNKNFQDKKREIREHKKLDTSIPKLRTQLKNLKTERRKMTDRCKAGSVLAPEDEPDWYKVLNVVFAETNAEIDPVSNAAETSFVNENTTHGDENEENSSGAETRDEESTNEDDAASQDKVQIIAAAGKKVGSKKVVASVHQKRKVIQSNKHALSEVGKGLQELSNSNVKRLKMILEAEKRREKEEREFRRIEAEKKREHELKVAKVYAKAFAAAMAPRQEPVQLPFSPTRLPSPPPNYNFPTHTLTPRQPSPTAPRYHIREGENQEEDFRLFLRYRNNNFTSD